jgi:hypothetical protein
VPVADREGLHTYAVRGCPGMGVTEGNCIPRVSRKQQRKKKKSGIRTAQVHQVRLVPGQRRPAKVPAPVQGIRAEMQDGVPRIIS